MPPTPKKSQEFQKNLLPSHHIKTQGERGKYIEKGDWKPSFRSGDGEDGSHTVRLNHRSKLNGIKEQWSRKGRDGEDGGGEAARGGAWVTQWKRKRAENWVHYVGVAEGWGSLSWGERSREHRISKWSQDACVWRRILFKWSPWYCGHISTP